MYKKYIILAIGLAVIGGALFLIQSTRSSKNVTEISVVKGGWVEVVSGKAFLVTTPGVSEIKKEIISGAAVNKDNILETNDKGNVAVHFFDGSVLRMSPSTRIIIKDAEYNKSSGKLTVRASLLVGKVWSKIIELATPDSLWQVETSNTVATVRGTAFGVSSDGKNSEIFGSQHSVSVAFIDPKTNTKLKAKSLIVAEGVSLKVSEADIENIKEIEKRSSGAPSIVDTITSTSSATILPLVNISEETKSDKWFNDNEDEDRKIEEEVVKIKEVTHSDRMELKKVLDQKTEERFFETIKKEEEKSKEKKNETNSAEKEIKIEKMSSSTEDVLKEDAHVEQKRLEDARSEEIRSSPEATSTKQSDVLNLNGGSSGEVHQEGGSSVKNEESHADSATTNENTTTTSTTAAASPSTSSVVQNEEHTSVRVESVETRESNTSETRSSASSTTSNTEHESEDRR